MVSWKEVPFVLAQKPSPQTLLLWNHYHFKRLNKTLFKLIKTLFPIIIFPLWDHCFFWLWLDMVFFEIMFSKTPSYLLNTLYTHSVMISLLKKQVCFPFNCLLALYKNSTSHYPSITAWEASWFGCASKNQTASACQLTVW